MDKSIKKSKISDLNEKDLAGVVAAQEAQKRKMQAEQQKEEQKASMNQAMEATLEVKLDDLPSVTNVFWYYIGMYLPDMEITEIINFAIKKPEKGRDFCDTMGYLTIFIYFLYHQKKEDRQKVVNLIKQQREYEKQNPDDLIGGPLKEEVINSSELLVGTETLNADKFGYIMGIVGHIIPILITMFETAQKKMKE